MRLLWRSERPFGSKNESVLSLCSGPLEAFCRFQSYPTDAFPSEPIRTTAVLAVYGCGICSPNVELPAPPPPFQSALSLLEVSSAALAPAPGRVPLLHAALTSPTSVHSGRRPAAADGPLFKSALLTARSSRAHTVSVSV